MTPLAAYLLLFVAVGTGFIFVHLVAGKLIRPSTPSAEKGTIYECGEPTIGSAWIQFDLRFYVVALLFVIFDVEVAFFFPWAEVFGKANAIANAPDPKTAAQYNDLGEKILDLAIPSDGTSAEASQNRWKKMATLTDREWDAIRVLGDQGQTALRWMRPTATERVKQVTPEQRPLLKTALAELQPLFAAQAAAREAAVKPLIDSGKEKDRESLRRQLRETLKGDNATLETVSLANLAAGRVQVLPFLQAPKGKGPMARPGPLLIAARQNPAVLADLERLASAQNRQLADRATRTLASLQTAAPGQTPLWDHLSLSVLQNLDTMTDEQFAALGDVSREGLLLVGNTTSTRQAQEQARTIAWLALGEILVFFGVLLVGFAYLWKRGDLAWVRSTTAAATVERVEAEQAALVPEAAQTLQHAGAAAHH